MRSRETRKMMTLGVSGWRIHGRRTGVGRYLLNIVRHWHQIEPFTAVRFYSPKALDPKDVPLPSLIQQIVVPSSWPMLIWENLLLGPRAKEQVLFCPSYSRPLFTRSRTVVTSHDAVQQIYPELFPLSVKLFYNHLYGWSARNATLVISDSEAGREDVIRYWRVPRERTRVVYLAPADFVHRTQKPEDLAEAKRIVGSDVPFFLFVGKISGRRNIPCMLEAFAHFKRETGQPHLLVLGGLNPHTLKLNELLAKLSISDSVRYCEYLPDREINLLYNATVALVMPSVYETVSLPVIEAQAAGAPVVCIGSNGMREVTGGAALFVDSLDVKLLAEAMERISGDAALREALSAKGIENVKRFSWERCAAETLAVLAEAASLP
jgi:glycosyltransferase involved in cell wall biosynthesis